MMGCAMVLGPVVGSVDRTTTPIETKLILGIVAPQPVKVHIHGFGAARLNVVGNNAMCSAVVGLNGCRGLFVSHC